MNQYSHRYGSTRNLVSCQTVTQNHPSTHRATRPPRNERDYYQYFTLFTENTTYPYVSVLPLPGTFTNSNPASSPVSAAPPGSPRA